jgi:hypothetical protein
MNFKEITSNELVHKQLGLDINLLPDVSKLPADEAQDTINSLLHKRMIKAINMDDDGTPWEPNYNDGSDHIEPWFGVESSDEKPGGFAFVVSLYAYWNTRTHCGSRLCFRDTERYEHALEHFRDSFLKTYLILK